MSHAIISLYAVPRELAHVEDITTAHPRRWLAAGWRDLRRAPASSIAYGVLFVIASYLITLGLVLYQLYYLLLPLIGGFFLVAPALGVGLYEISRRLERGETPTLLQAMSAIGRRRFQLSTMGAALVVIYVIWLMAANLIFALLGSGITPTAENALAYLLSAENAPMLAVGSLVGAIFALGVFAATAVSVPMLLDRDEVDLFSAMQTSLAAFRYNWRPMLLWAGIILAVMLGGFLTLYVGLVIGFPLLGHATWHAYKDLVKP